MIFNKIYCKLADLRHTYILQFPDDHLLAKQNLSRISDVVLVKLFNPETSYEIEVTGLSHPVSLALTLKNTTLLNSTIPKVRNVCFKVLFT
mgnify:CR=1 FL=1